MLLEQVGCGLVNLDSLLVDCRGMDVEAALVFDRVGWCGDAASFALLVEPLPRQVQRYAEGLERLRLHRPTLKGLIGLGIRESPDQG